MLDVFESFLKEKFSSDDHTVLSVFKAFDQDNDDSLNDIEFEQFLQQLFKKSAQEYQLSKQQVEDFRYLVNLQQSNAISVSVFSLLWSHCVKSILSPKSTLVLFDLQNDHASKLNTDVKLNLFSNLNDLTERSFNLFTCVLDWHPETHSSFYENIESYKDSLVQYPRHSIDEVTVGDFVTFKVGDYDYRAKLTRRHCVQNTQGAQMVNHLNIPTDCARILKGTDPMFCSRSAFRDFARLPDTGLLKLLQEKEISDVYIAGIGLSEGVKHTALESIKHGFRTCVIWDACCESCSSKATTSQQAEDLATATASTYSMLSDNGVAIVMTDEVEEMLNCGIRRPEMGYVSLVNYAMAMKKLSTINSSPKSVIKTGHANQESES